MPTARSVTLKGSAICAALLSCAGTTLAQNGFSPDATMLKTPDISDKHIAFVYANDLWLVDREGGVATKIASPSGAEARPRFSPDNQTLAFVGNYDGNRDIYTLPVDGAGVAHRVTHHPAGEFLSDWTPDGRLIFHAGLMHDRPKSLQLFTVDAQGGLPEALPVPYGTLGAISPDGKWLAYTPYTRDSRTWKRYRGGMATDIWLFNLETYESVKMTEFEGTDTQPMWSADGKSVYYLSDGGPEHRINVWRYDVARQTREQITDFKDFDVRDASMGPGERNRGEIVFQLGSEMRVLDVRNKRSRTVDITIPGERANLRASVQDAAPFLVGGDISATGKRVVAEARGEIWTVPAEDGIVRNLTRTSGVAERSPAWSPDGRWIAYLSDATGEYEVYITQSDGKGETKQLTSDGDMWRQISGWSPDSAYIVYNDKSGRLWLLNVESQEQTLVTTDPQAQQLDVSWSKDSKWITFSRTDADNYNGVICLYNLDEGVVQTVTSNMFNSTSPAFDRAGDYLYFASDRHFTSPEFSSLDTTWVYNESTVLIAVPLHDEVENPWELTNDEEEWEADDDEADDKADEGDDADASDADADADDDAEADDDADAPADEIDRDHPLFGVWEGTYNGVLDMVKATLPPGLPDEVLAQLPTEVDFTLTILPKTDGTFGGYSVVMGEEDDLGDVTWDGTTVTFTDEQDGITSTTTATVDGDTMTGTWTASGGPLPREFSGSMSGERSDEEPDIEAAEAAGGDDDDEPVVIDLENFEARAFMLPVSPGSLGNLAVNDKNQLMYIRSSDSPPNAKLIDVSDIEDGEKNVLSGCFGFTLSADGKKMVAASFSGFGTAKAGTGASIKALDLSSAKMLVEPREEWRNVVTDAWRRYRDFFYDEAMHGVDWQAVLDRYLPMVDDAVVRDDVSYIIREMISELNVGHAYYQETQLESQPFENVGMLGVDFALGTDDDGNEAYTFDRFYQGGDWEVDARNPLKMPGMDIEEGQFLLAVNGIPMDTSMDPWAAFQGTQGKTTILTISDDPVMGGEDDREVMVKPHSTGEEYNLRYRAWIERNRQYVSDRTDGEIGYIYVTNTGVPGHNDMVRQFFGQRQKAALIIDERWNGGGFIPHRLIEILDRPLTNFWALRDGSSWMWPPDSHQGPKAMLINGMAGSGGDMFPALFRQAGLGKIVGTRTWGGLVGITGMPGMIDGSGVSVPNFAYYEADGTWGIEGHGVDPDIEVLDDPALMVNGDDPQIDAAIRQLQQELLTNRFVPTPRPQGPDRSGMGIEEADK